MNNILSYFPHKEFREDQKETLLQIEEYINDPEIENICLEMPTGGGKSAIAFTVARYLYTFWGNRSYIVTPQKILQDQYYSDVLRLDLANDITLLKGKGNYKCVAGFGNCDSCILSAGKKCIYQPECEYYSAEYATITARSSILNYSMLNILDNKLFNKSFQEGIFNQDVYDSYKREFLIIDESHNTEGFIMDLISTSISIVDDDKKKNLGMDFNTNEAIEEYKNYLTGEMFRVQSDISNEVGHVGNACKRLSKLKKKYEKVEYLQTNINSGNFVFVPEIKENEDKKKYLHAIIAKPIFVSQYARNFFRCSNRRLFISATLPGKEVLCRSLGLAEDNTVFIKLKNRFPVENRKIYFTNKSHLLPVTNSNIIVHGENVVYGPIINMIKQILTYDFLSEEKGLIITHSNVLMEKITKECGHLREFIKCSGNVEIEDGEEVADKRLHFVNKHINNKSNSVLIGPFLYEGLDLKYDLARFVIMVKCPYPFEDNQIKARREKDYQWYVNNIAIKIVQGLGRGMRAKDDWVLNFLLDPNFDILISGRGKNFIPGYIKESLQIIPKCFIGKGE